MFECFQKDVNFSIPVFRRALAVELGVSKMIVDDELITIGGLEMVQENSRIPILTGVALHEWAHKKPEFYQFIRFENLTKHQIEDSVQRVIENAFLPRLANKVTNATIDLIANATYYRYLEGKDETRLMPNVVKKLQNVSWKKSENR